MNLAWNDQGSPVGMSVDQLLYRIRKDDGSDGLIFDSVTLDDILSDEGVERFVFDAMVTPFSRLSRKMEQMLKVMNRAVAGLEVTAMQVSDPFRRNGVAQVAAVFELSDGQTVTVYFHNPDSTPSKLAPTDEMVSWKWLLNKKDITIVVAPEKGQDLAVREVSRRIMVLADRNSAAFAKQNSQRAERLQRIQGIKDEIAELEIVRDQKRNELDLAQVESQSRSLNEKKSSVADGLAALASIKHFINRNQYRTIADAMRGDDKAHFIDKARLLADIINGMAETYEQDGKGMDATAYLHYFGGSKDWYITEKDNQGGTRQAFGWTGSGEGGELGYISIDDLTRSNIELDLHFDPKPLSGIVQEEPQKEVKEEPEIKDAATPVIELTGKELGEFPDTAEGKKALRAAAKNSMRSMLGQWFECPALDTKVEIRNSGIKKTLSLSGDPRKLKLIPALEGLIRSADKISSSQSYAPNIEPSIIAYHYLSALVALEGSTLAVRFVIKESDEGVFHWDHSVHANNKVFDSVKEIEAHISASLPVTTSCGGIEQRLNTRLVSNQPCSRLIEADKNSNLGSDQKNNDLALVNCAYKPAGRAQGGNAEALDSVDATELNLSALLPDEPSSGLHSGGSIDEKTAQTKAALDSSSAADALDRTRITIPGKSSKEILDYEAAGRNPVFDSAGGLVL
ncbi:MAG: hypothetical protein ACRC8Q_13005, partial [Aeromonas sp.]